MSDAAITRNTCGRCGLDADRRGPAAAQEYARQGRNNREKVERFNAYVSRHPYLRRCRGCGTIYCTRPGCTCRC